MLESFWPGAAAIDSPIALALVGRYPTPDSASRLGEKRMASGMDQHSYCGRRSAAELLARLRAAPTGLAGDADADAKGELARALVGEIAKLSSRIKHIIADLPDGKIVMSFPRAGRIFAARILAKSDNSRHASARAADIYRRARQRGCKHPYAVSILARAWVRVLWRAWQSSAIYNPDKHIAATKSLPDRHIRDGHRMPHAASSCRL